MSFPVRCFTCGKVIGNKYESYVLSVYEQKTRKKAQEKARTQEEHPSDPTKDNVQKEGLLRGTVGSLGDSLDDAEDQPEGVSFCSLQHMEKSIEGIVLDELGLVDMCCRRMFLCHVEIV